MNNISNLRYLHHAQSRASPSAVHEKEKTTQIQTNTESTNNTRQEYTQDSIVKGELLRHVDVEKNSIS